MPQTDARPGRADARRAEPERQRTLREWIDAAADQFGDAAFLIDPATKEQWSYAEWRARARARATDLARRGLQRGDRVALLTENGLGAVEWLSGAWYCGCVPLPLSPTSGPRAVSYALEHGGAKLVAASEALRDSLVEPVPAPVVPIDAEPAAPGAAVPEPFGPGADGLLIYTSGSTGRPKGVLFDHAGLAACARNTARSHELGPDDRFLCTLPLYHMNSIDKLLGVMRSGGSIVLPRRFELASFWRWIEDFQCTWLAIVPTLVAQLVRWSEGPSVPPRRVRFARCSSAPLGEADQRAFERRFGIPLIQGMGTTETGGLFLNPIPPKPARSGSLGVPWGYEVRLIGSDGGPVSAGEPGRLAVRGDARMRGYHRDEAATREAIDAEGWLRTGDHVYRDADGFYYAAGREKELIIKSGTNIAPREIDEVIEAHPAVAEAAAVGVPNPTFGEDVVAFVVLRPGRPCGERELLDHCAALIGELKRPSAIHFTDALPHGPSGKLQRLRLRDVAVERAARESSAAPGAAAGYVAPRSATERTLCALWAEMLDCERVGVHDNFFALGGFSLVAFRLLVGVRRRLDAELPLAVFYERPTVAEQAAYVDERARRGEGAVGRPEPLVPVREGCTAPPLFCVFGPSRYRRLAELLGDGQPTYGLFAEREFDVLAPGRDGGVRVSFPTVEELAAQYIEQVRRVQPEGPLHLAGLSFGGRIALEMAHQLTARGEPVALVAAFDTYMPGAAVRNRWGWLRYHLARALREGPATAWHALQQKRRQARGRAYIASGAAPRATDAGAAMGRNAELRRRAREAHHPKPYAGRIVLFRAMQAIEYLPHYDIDPLLGWGRLARGELRVHDIPGTHTGIMRDPGVARLAELLRGYLPGAGADA